MAGIVNRRITDTVDPEDDADELDDLRVEMLKCIKQARRIVRKYAGRGSPDIFERADAYWLTAIKEAVKDARDEEKDIGEATMAECIQSIRDLPPERRGD